jgi:hypothetical protein
MMISPENWLSFACGVLLPKRVVRKRLLKNLYHTRVMNEFSNLIVVIIYHLTVINCHQTFFRNSSILNYSILHHHKSLGNRGLSLFVK